MTTQRLAARWRSLDPWAATVALVAGVFAAPLAAIVWIAILPEENIWPHLLRTALPGYLRNTLALGGLVAVGSALVGATTAWLVASYRFPGRAVFEWGLLAPLAVPAYIAAYVYVELLEYAGPAQSAMRAAFGWRDSRDYWFPEIRSLGGAAVVMSFAFYPYVYLLARAAFREQTATAMEAARALGCGPLAALRRVALPLARPAIAAGVALALMETLNDFGTVDFFGVPTLTIGVYTIWLESFNPGGAAQLALVILALVFFLVVAERVSRRRARFDSSARYRPRQGRPLHGWRAALAFLVCLTPMLGGFVFPVATLAWRAAPHLDSFAEGGFLLAGVRTAGLAGTSAAVAVVVGLLLVFAASASRSPFAGLVARVATLGYAIPGAVLAIGILYPLLAVDHALHGLGLIGSTLLGGSAFAVGAAYVIRFAAIPHGAIESGFARVTPAMAAVARTLGETRVGALRRVQLPLLRSTLLSTWLLVFVESVKELPATLMLRPFDFDTLATLAYTYASLEQFEAAAPAALTIVAVGVAPAILLGAQLRRATWSPRAEGSAT